MSEESMAAAKMEQTSFRVTRARAKALGTSGGLMQKPPRPELKKALRACSKRTTSDQNKPMSSATACSQNKRRAVLSDVSNIFHGRSQAACSSAAKILANKQEKVCHTRKNLKVAQSAARQLQQGGNVKVGITEAIPKITGEPRDVMLPTKGRVASDTENLMADHCEVFASRVKLEKKVEIHSSESLDGNECYEADARPVKQSCRGPSIIHSLFKKEEKAHEQFIDPEIVDIDSDQRDPQMCSLYVPDIYHNKLVSERNCRPSAEYMDKVQRDISRSMRKILIDWLVEVSEEYKLVPDTLYLTVNLIDRFLSCNYIEKQRLQLLGVTCMLIASKYEEISAPRVEEFCFITDDTYTKEEVVKMESAVLNFLCFQLSVPTIKTFLRRFIQAAQSTSENPSIDVEYLANYLAELTLAEYSFLKFLPSLIAASAVLLARWTLDQSITPWNPTLEHYTSYKIMDLKVTVVAIEELQLNAKNSSANAIREKYRQQKFNCVANLSSSKAVQTLF